MWLLDVTLRLGAGMLAGALLGLDRERHNKPAGLRTLALVGLGSALFTTLGVTSASPDTAVDSVFRVVQGIITGIGFLGAGAILRRDDESGVRGLTTAAAIWIVAGLGIASGLGQWPVMAVGLALGLVVLTAGRPLEDRLRGRADSHEGTP